MAEREGAGRSPSDRVDTAHLFEPLGRELLSLLRGLEPGPAGWEAATSAGGWAVRDVAAHLLDGALRRIGAERDGHVPGPDRALGSYGDVVAYLDRLNGEWVAAARRLSTRLLTELLDFAEGHLAAALEGVDPDAPARFPVAWVGPGGAPAAGDPSCNVRADGLELARLLMHRRREEEARAALAVDGDADLVEPLLRARAVMVRGTG